MQNGKVISQRCDPILSKKTPRKVVYTLVPTTPSYIKYLNFLDLYYIYAYIYGYLHICKYGNNFNLYLHLSFTNIHIYAHMYMYEYTRTYNLQCDSS